MFNKMLPIVFALVCTTGCNESLFMAKAPVFEARGKYTGQLSPVTLQEDGPAGRQIIGIQLAIDAGPSLKERGAPERAAKPVAGKSAILVDDSQQPLLWPEDQQQGFGTVTGMQNSRWRTAKLAGGRPLRAKSGDEVRTYVLVADKIDWDSPRSQ